MNARHYMDEHPTAMFRYLGRNETTLDPDIADFDWRRKSSWQFYMDRMLEDGGSDEEVEKEGSQVGEQEGGANINEANV